MENNPIQESTAMSKVDFYNHGWRGHFINKPFLEKPLIDQAPVYNLAQIREVMTEKDKSHTKTKIKIVEEE